MPDCIHIQHITFTDAWWLLHYRLGAVCLTFSVLVAAITSVVFQHKVEDLLFWLFALAPLWAENLFCLLLESRMKPLWVEIGNTILLLIENGRGERIVERLLVVGCMWGGYPAKTT
jgi:hypothetical protein